MCGVSELLARCDAGDPPPVILLGPGKAPSQREPFEPLLAEQTVSQIIDKFVDPSLRDLALTVYYADETEPGEVVAEAETFPFLAERRVVVVRSAERYAVMSGDKKSPFAPLARYLESPCAHTILIFVAAKADKRRQLYRSCGKAGVVVECPQLSDAELRTWAQKRASARGKRLEGAATAELLSRAGTALGDVNNAVDLVVTYIGDAERVTAGDVVAACADVSEDTVWDMTDAIASSDPDKALRALYQLVELGNAPDQIMGVINWMIESAYRAAPETGVSVKSEFVRKKMMPLVNKLGVKKLRDACVLCTDTHFMLRSTGTDPLLALELLVIKLSSRTKRRRAE